jgi:phenylacetate-CoA ligase
MALYSLDDLIARVRKDSPFYREFYSDLPAKVSITDVPILDQTKFWESNGIQGNRVLTGPMHDGVVFFSGGTTGNPKFSIFSREEFTDFTRTFGTGMVAGGLRAGDKVANLFRAGQLYASFMIMSRSFELGPEPVLQFPITSTTPHPDALKVIRDFGVDVLAGFVTAILNLADYYDQHRDEYAAIKIKKILYTGEGVYPDQRANIERIFPGVRLLSLGYASVDAGMLGYADEKCGPNEHYPFTPETIFEIVDEDTGELITEPDRPGKVVITNLIRVLLPIIRYPVGDRAMWIDPPGASKRRFRLLGRSGEAARLASENIYYDDLRSMLDKFRSQLGISNYQIVLSRRDGIDLMTLRIAATAAKDTLAKETAAVVEEIYQSRPGIRDLVKVRRSLPPEIEWVNASELYLNDRTGKLKRIIDNKGLSK